MTQLRTQVLVVGAGPVGAVAAERLAQHGIDVVLIDAEPDCREDMRASTLHAPTLAMLDELGVLGELDAQGLRAPVYHYRERASGHVLAFDLADIADATPFPYRLQCEQYKLARLLAARLATRANARMLFSHRLLALQQDASGVTAQVEAPFEILRIRADYVIAADGANSLVRKWLGIAFDGFTYPEKFLTLSTAFAIERHVANLAAVNYVADPAEWCVLLRVPTLWRVLVPVHDAAADARLLSDDKMVAVFAGLVGDAAARVQTYHRTIYRVHQRVAARFRVGRVMLAGDAAHLNNPLGGFGMNAGIHDAWNLTAKLIGLYAGEGDPDATLNRYDRQRRTIMHEFVQAQTISNRAALASADAFVARRREMEAILADDGRRRDYLLTQSMINSLARADAIA